MRRQVRRGHNKLCLYARLVPVASAGSIARKYLRRPHGSFGADLSPDASGNSHAQRQSVFGLSGSLVGPPRLRPVVTRTIHSGVVLGWHQMAQVGRGEVAVVVGQSASDMVAAGGGTVGGGLSAEIGQPSACVTPGRSRADLSAALRWADLDERAVVGIDGVLDDTALMAGVADSLDLASGGGRPLTHPFRMGPPSLALHGLVGFEFLGGPGKRLSRDGELRRASARLIRRHWHLVDLKYHSIPSTQSIL